MNSSFVRLATIAVLAIAASSMSQDARGDLFTNDNRAPGPSYHSQNGVTFFPGGAPPVQLSFFDIFVDINDRIPPPPPGNNVSSFFDIFFDVELDGITFRGTGNMGVRLNGLPPGEPVIRSLIDTEMLSMDLLGLPNGVRIRESPTRQSLAATSQPTLAKGTFTSIVSLTYLRS